MQFPQLPLVGVPQYQAPKAAEATRVRSAECAEPTDSIADSCVTGVLSAPSTIASFAPRVGPAVLSKLVALAKQSAMFVQKSVGTGIGAIGLFLVGPHRSQRQLEEYSAGEKIISGDCGFRDRVATSAFDGLLELMRRPELPGQNAAERLDFILWYTDSNRDSHDSSWTEFTRVLNHFHPDSPFVNQANDRGFADDVADGRKWYNPDATGFFTKIPHDRLNEGSPQVGHFLTAVDIGRQSPILSGLLRVAAVGHELIGDDQGAVQQILAGVTHPQERKLFGQAITAAKESDRGKAHQLVETALPDLTVEGNEPGRVGNSKQDLLNTSYGVAFGELVRSGHFQSREQAADWLDQNVGRKAASLAWNEPDTTP